MFGIPNGFAGLLELLIPVCVSLLFSRAVKPGMKIMCGWLGGLCLVALALTGSRGGWVSLTLALMVWPMLATRRWRRKAVGILAVMIVVSGGLWRSIGGMNPP